MRHLSIGACMLIVLQQNAEAQDGCDANITQYLAQAAEQGAQAETNTRSIESVPTAREAGCLASILDRDTAIWVSYPDFSRVAGEVARRGCRAVEDAVDDVLNQIPSLNGSVPGVGGVGGGLGRSPNVVGGSLGGNDQVLDSSLLEALEQLRNRNQ